VQEIAILDHPSMRRTRDPEAAGAPPLPDKHSKASVYWGKQARLTALLQGRWIRGDLQTVIADRA
jgi:hypothetical protein